MRSRPKRRRAVKKIATSKLSKLLQRRLTTAGLTLAVALLVFVVLFTVSTEKTKHAQTEACDYKPDTVHIATETDIATAQAVGKDMIISCFGEEQWPFAQELWMREASWRPLAINPSSGACGIVQAVPCSKLLNAVGKQTIEATTVEEQMHWGVNYIKNRYGTPQNALKFWKSRKPINGKDVGNWY
jgi:hypothetical protein